MIYNLSYNTLTEDAYSFLIKGLPFVPTLTKTFKQETNKSWNRFKTCMLTQYFFAITFIITPPPTPLRGSPVEHPLPLTTHTLTNLFTCTEEDLISVNTPCRKIYSNLTLQKKLALNKLKTNQSIVIKPFDKGEGICIMNARDYLTNIHTHTYKIANIQTTHLQPNKCNGQWYMHSHRIYTFPTHDWQGRKEIFTAS